MKLRHKRRRWPREPRYTVGSVTGVQITQGVTTAGGGMRRPMPSVWYVHDAADCYRVVVDTGWDEHKARSIAADLNAEEREWLAKLH